MLQATRSPLSLATAAAAAKALQQAVGTRTMWAPLVPPAALLHQHAIIITSLGFYTPMHRPSTGPA